MNKIKRKFQTSSVNDNTLSTLRTRLVTQGLITLNLYADCFSLLFVCFVCLLVFFGGGVLFSSFQNNNNIYNFPVDINGQITKDTF